MAAVLGRGDMWTSLLFIFPLFLIYEVGVLFTPVMNGVDFVSRNLFAAVGYSRRNYLLMHVGLAASFILLIAWLRHARAFPGRAFLPMLLESGVYALTLGSFILFVMRKLLGIEPSLGAGARGGFSAVLVSLGAGVHEELVFRVGACAGGAAVARTAGMAHRPAVATAFVVSSVLFSAAHHLGPGGEAWAFDVFTYRFLAGLLFASIFFFRSLAHAVYTHALYDVYVLALR